MESEYTIESGKVTVEAEVDGKTVIISTNARNIAVKAHREEERIRSWEFGERFISYPPTYTMDLVPDDKGKFLTFRQFSEPLEVESNVSVTIVPTAENIESARIRVGAPSTALVGITPLIADGGMTYLNTNSIRVGPAQDNVKKKVTFTWIQKK